MAKRIFVPGSAGAQMMTVADRTALSVLGAPVDGQLAMVLTDNSLWRYDSGYGGVSDYTGTAAIPAGGITSANLVIEPPALAGAWIRADKAFIARYAFVQATLDNVALLTVPQGMCLRLTGMPFFTFTRVVAGNADRTVGASGSFGGFGGGGGDFIGPTTPVVGPAASAIGTDFSAAEGATPLTILQTCLIREAETVSYEITAAGTGGAEADGMICLPVALLTPTNAMIS